MISESLRCVSDWHLPKPTVAWTLEMIQPQGGFVIIRPTFSTCESFSTSGSSPEPSERRHPYLCGRVADSAATTHLCCCFLCQFQAVTGGENFAGRLLLHPDWFGMSWSINCLWKSINSWIQMVLTTMDRDAELLSLSWPNLPLASVSPPPIA